MITDYIGTGKANAVTRSTLCAMTGMDDRSVREAIEHARHEGAIIINTGNGCGYYIADKLNDRAEIEHQRNVILSRVKAQLHYVKFYSEALKGGA